MALIIIFYIIIMNLSSLAKHKNIVIQCPDITDADSIGSAFALQQFFKFHGSECKIVHGGKAKITKPSLVMFMAELGISIEKVSELFPEPDLLLTVNCQYGTSNAQKFPCKDFAVIDNHFSEIKEGENTEINPAFASCSTLVWDMMRKENFDFSQNSKLRDALYYGLFSATNGLSELRHPLDRDLADINFDKALVKKLNDSALTIKELRIVSATLDASRRIENQKINKRVALFKAEDFCSQDVLAFTCDVARKVDILDACIVYCLMGDYIRIAVRSSAREIMASELAEFICAGVGNGGGSIEMANGFFKANEEYFIQKVRDYLDNYELIYAGKTPVDFASMKRYRKKSTPIGFAKTEDMFKDGWPVTIRTLEGDIDLRAGKDIYVMIGIIGEVYPILREKFEKRYEVLDTPYDLKTEYAPEVINKITGEKLSLLSCARTCVPKGEKVVKAAPVEKPTKVFSYWDTEKYFSAKPGDFLAANEDDLSDCYVVNRQIFFDSYEEA
jgi:phosphoglycolate phosphatase